ncbi:Zn-ribbon domain-containing OB-fold protein [Nocardia jiangxiensis]|uniref:Zn-ribbon domain-containing OB-fold protein n=1 Tax=Nocardia jiangxiensis TaxID=282685 RepID=A0ABW6SDZ5_9NOCA
MNEYAGPVPDVNDSLTAPFWEATRENRLVVQRCSSCGYLRWPPGPACNECLAPGGEWTELSPVGSLYSYAEYHLAFNPAFKDEIPYVVGLVELDQGPRMYGLMRSQPSTADIGRKVGAVFESVTNEVTLVRWELM